MTDSDVTGSCMHVPSTDLVVAPRINERDVSNDVRAPYVARVISRVGLDRYLRRLGDCLSLHAVEVGVAVRAGWPFAAARPADVVGSLLAVAVSTRTRVLVWLALTAAAVLIAAVCHFAAGGSPDVGP